MWQICTAFAYRLSCEAVSSAPMCQLTTVLYLKLISVAFNMTYHLDERKSLRERVSSTDTSCGCLLKMSAFFFLVRMIEGRKGWHDLFSVAHSSGVVIKCADVASVLVDVASVVMEPFQLGFVCPHTQLFRPAINGPSCVRTLPPKELLCLSFHFMPNKGKHTSLFKYWSVDTSVARSCVIHVVCCFLLCFIVSSCLCCFPS